MATAPAAPVAKAPPKHQEPDGCLAILWEIAKEKYPKERTPLVVALILLMALPGVVLLVTGTWKKTGCKEDQVACREQCRSSWDDRKSELVGEAKYVVRNELEKTRECYDECDEVAGRCSTEVMMLFIGVGCFAGACACAITMALLIGQNSSSQVEEIEAPRPRRASSTRSAFEKKSRPSPSGSPSSPSAGDRPGSGRKKGSSPRRRRHKWR